MKYRIIILIIVFTGCATPIKKDNPEKCLMQIDSIARTQTFHEATILAETCLNQNKINTEINLKLAELYLLSYLVDNEEDGLNKARVQFGKTLKIDTTFATNHSHFNLNRNDLKKLSKIWIYSKRQL